MEKDIVLALVKRVASYRAMTYLPQKLFLGSTKKFRDKNKEV